MSTKKCGYLEQTTRGLTKVIKRRKRYIYGWMSCRNLVVIKDRPTLVTVRCYTSKTITNSIQSKIYKKCFESTASLVTQNPFFFVIRIRYESLPCLFSKTQVTISSSLRFPTYSHSQNTSRMKNWINTLLLSSL